MVSQPDYIIFKPAPTRVESTQAPPDSGSPKLYPMTRGVWQREALDTLKMYAPEEGRFSPVKPTEAAGTAMAGGTVALAQGPEQGSRMSTCTPLFLGLDDPAFLGIPHRDDLRFFATDTLPFARQLQGPYVPCLEPLAVPPPRVGKASDVSDLTGGALFDPTKTELKADHFPDRLIYMDGGLYPAGSKDNPEVAKAHENAPNYRRMPGKPIHGVGQPTKQGYHDVLDHLGARDKPAVWTNTRAEAVMYIDGKPHNLRELMARENLDIKAGASGAELEALEDELKQKLLARGKIDISEEVPVLGSDGKPAKDDKGRIRTTRQTRSVELRPDNCQTTQDVIQGLKDEGYQIEYRRIPISDEKSPSAADLDTLRAYMNEMKEKYPDQDVQYVFNCHQGKGRTTTAMVSAGILLDGKSSPLHLPIVGDILGDDPKARAERNIDQNFHLQNLREVVDEYKSNASDAGKRADRFRQEATAEPDTARKADLEKKAAEAEAERARTEEKAREFTKRYSMMIKYSEYVCKHGPDATTPSFEQWMGEKTQVKDLDSKWAFLNAQLGLAPAGAELQTAFA